MVDVVLNQVSPGIAESFHRRVARAPNIAKASDIRLEGDKLAAVIQSIAKLSDLVRGSETRCNRYLTYDATATYVNCF